MINNAFHSLLDHAFNGGGAPNLSSAAQLMSGDGSSTGQSTVGLNSATGLLPMQIPALTSLTAAASLPAMGAPNLRPSSLSFNFDSLSSKRHYSCPVCYKVPIRFGLFKFPLSISLSFEILLLIFVSFLSFGVLHR